jgi:hypothetical protein
VPLYFPNTLIWVLFKTEIHAIAAAPAAAAAAAAAAAGFLGFVSKRPECLCQS